MQINKTSFAVGVGSAVLLGAALVPAWAAAQTGDEDPTATPTESATATATDEGEGEDEAAIEECGPGLGFVVRAHVGEDLAQALGVTTDELEAAFEAAHDAVGDPERPLSPEEAEAFRDEIRAAVAEELGITVEELEAAETEVREAHQAEAIARVQEMVDEGTLSQEQADAIIERIESGVGRFALPSLRHHLGSERGFHDEMFEGGPFEEGFFFGPPLFDDSGDAGGAGDAEDAPTA